MQQNDAMKKILLISHNAERAGAPILLLSMARLLKQNGWTVDFLLKTGGELENEFSQIARTTLLHQQTISVAQKLRQRIRKSVLSGMLKQNLHEYNCIISNTITNGDLHFLLKRHNRVLTYVHELRLVFETSTAPELREKVQQHTHLFLYPSEVVLKLLQKEFNHPQCKRLPYFIPDYLSQKQQVRKRTRQELKIPEDMFIVGGMGSPSARKGVDVFLQTAKKTMVAKSKIAFVWCGGMESSTEWLLLKTDIEKTGLVDCFHLIPSVEDSWKVMAAFDLFFLSSREDAYPLVMIEAAMMEIPILYFQNSGGADEFLGLDAGFQLPYLDVDTAIEKIIEITNDPTKIKPVIAKARKRYEELHSAEAVVPHINDILNLQ